MQYLKSRFCLFFASLLFVSVSAFATTAVDVPTLTAETLFHDILIDNEFEGWTVIQLGEIITWSQGNLTSIDKSDQYLLKTPIPALTEKPVRIQEQYSTFFQGVPRDEHRYWDGSWIGIKYAFFRQSLTHPEYENLSEEPIYFYLVKKAPDSLDETLLQTPPSEERVLDVQSNLLETYFAFHDFTEDKNDQDALKKAADLGHPLAILILTLFEESPAETPEYENKLKTIADFGYGAGQKFYAEYAQRHQRFDVAIQYFKLLADQGDVESQFKYAVLMEQGHGTPDGTPNFIEAVKYFKLSADGGRIRSGDSDSESDDEDDDPRANGYYLAQMAYAEMMERGIGTESGEPNLLMAAVYYKLAADQDCSEGQLKYAQLVLQGVAMHDSLPNFPEAEAYLKKAADGGELLALFMYADLCSSEWGIVHGLANSDVILHYYLVGWQDIMSSTPARRDRDIADVRPYLVKARDAFSLAAIHGNEEALKARNELMALSMPQ